MKKICITVLKVFGAAVLFLVMSLLFLLIVTPFENDRVAGNTAKELAELPLPENTEYIESVYRAGKLIGCGNGMQYLGAILIRSDLSLEALKAHYSSFAEHEWECVVERQTSAEIKWVEYAGGLSFKTEVEGDDYYIVYSWGDSDSVFHDLDIRGH